MTAGLLAQRPCLSSNGCCNAFQIASFQLSNVRSFGGTKRNRLGTNLHISPIDIAPAERGRVAASERSNGFIEFRVLLRHLGVSAILRAPGRRGSAEDLLAQYADAANPHELFPLGWAAT
jgi:hypothetical protein